MPYAKKLYCGSALVLALAFLDAQSVGGAETQVNADLMPPAPVTSGKTTNPTPVEGGPAGTGFV